MDELVLNEEKRKLAEENYNLLKYFISDILNNKRISNCYKDEFISDANFAYLRSAAKYNVDRKEKFSTFVQKGQKINYSNFLKKIKNNNRQNKQILFTYYKYRNDVNKENQKKEERENYLNKEFLLNILDKYGKESNAVDIIKLYFLEENTLKNIGEKYSMTGERIRQIIKNELFNIKKYFDRNKIVITDFF